MHLGILGHNLTLLINPKLTQLSVTKPSNVSLQFENTVYEYRNTFTANILCLWCETPVKLAVKSPLLRIADFLMAAVTVDRTAITFHHHNHAEPVSFSIHYKCCRILHE